jgi:hypothetical protein
MLPQEWTMDFPDFLKLMNAVPLTEEEVLCSSNIATIATKTYHAHHIIIYVQDDAI